ncbi:OCIAD1 [Branchiostoma lanceolatum]|uniref:OCIAD1 protein n=1 Tax=Branchiostoma lanceolatum TaxID=7740 RepID=A0A8K0A1E8_BRALA|nr:OCIAD1 [Branchiostoma lanceolatum]
MASNSLEHGGDGPVEGSGRSGVLPGGPGVAVPGPEGKQLTVSPEEMQIFQQCRRESFFYRCLPIGGVFGLATNRLLAAGFLKPGRFGTGPKYMLAAVAGWILGKWSYMKTCENKFLLLESSNIGDMIRKRRGMVPIGGDGASADPWGTPGHDGSGTLQAPDMGYGQYRSPVQSSDYGSSSSFEQGSSGGFRDTEVELSGPVEAFGPMSIPEDEQSKKYMTYEELRKRNREASPPPLSAPPPPSFQPSYRIGRDGSRESIEERAADAQWRKNQYGDLRD